MKMTVKDTDHLSGGLDDLATTMGMEDRSVLQLAREMARLGFQAGQLGRSMEAWERMISEDEITIFLGLAGAMVPAGLRKLISFMICERMVDCVVSTGANIFHDLCEGLGVVHYRGDPSADDGRLREEGIDRIFDVYVSEAGLQKGDLYIADFAKGLDPDRFYSSRELMEMLGGDMPEETILGSARRAGVPIFVPALSDSSIGIGMVLAWRAGHRVVVDQIRDVDEISQITEKSSQTGVVLRRRRRPQELHPADEGGGRPLRQVPGRPQLRHPVHHRSPPLRGALRLYLQRGGLRGGRYRRRRG